MTRPISLTARMTLLFASSAAIILLVAGVLFVRAGNDRFLDNDRDELDGKMNLVRDILGSARSASDLETLPARLRDAAVGHPGMAVVVSEGGKELFAAGDRQVIDHLSGGRELGVQQPWTWRLGERIFRIDVAQYPLGIPGTMPALVGIALDVSKDQAFLKGFEESLWFGIVLIGVALGWLGWVVVRHGLDPLRGVSARIAATSAQELDRPLIAANVPRELEELVTAFNSTLARLHDSFRRLTEFSDDLAHELRTPINNLLLQTQITLDGEASLEHYRAALQANEEECQRLSRMISDMLFIAKADNHLVLPDRELLDLDVEVAALLEFYEPLASDQRIRLEQHGAARIAADRVMLRRALSNLLANAVRFTGPDHAIRVEIAVAEPGWIRLAVINPGPPIPEDQRERVFERLYRVDPARRGGKSDHVGLGLAITRSIVRMHGGRIELECRDGQTTFTICLPGGTDSLERRR